MSGRQTIWGSIVEAKVNILVGFTINYIANLLIFPLFGMHISALNNLWMGCIYTCISLIRQFIIRRYFNGLRWGHHASR